MSYDVEYVNDETTAVISRHGIVVATIMRKGSFLQIDMKYAEGGAENYMCGGVEKWRMWSNGSSDPVIFQRIAHLRDSVVKFISTLRLNDHNSLPYPFYSELAV